MEERAQGEIVKWGFLSLIALMVVVLVNDVSAWVHGDLDFKKKDAKPASTRAKSEVKTDTSAPSPATGSQPAEVPASVPAEVPANTPANAPSSEPKETK